METLLNRHLNSDLAHTSRAAQRKLKLLEIEKEQRIEEAEALKMTEEQRQILHRSFSSVKVEFSDLDGLSWCGTRPGRVTSSDQAFVVLTNADLASFGPHETIRASASSRPRPKTSMSSSNLSGRPFSSPPSTSPTLRHAHSTFSLASPSSSSTETIKAILNNHRATRSRSPIKGLFPSDAYESDSERTIRGSDSDYDESLRPKKERKKERTSKRALPSRCIPSPSVAAISARSAAKRLAAAVSNRKSCSVSASAEPQVSLPASPPPQTTAYPAYITYSKTSPSISSPPQSKSSLPCSDIPQATKAPISPSTL